MNAHFDPGPKPALTDHDRDGAPASGAPLACWSRSRADAFRIYGVDSASTVLKAFLLRRTFRPILTLRICQALASRGLLARVLLAPCLLLHRWARQQAAMDLPWQLQVAPGFAIDHGWALVVNASVRIGANVTLYHGVTLGQRDRIDALGQRVTDFPVIEDQVWIGPHAVIVGAVRIGRGSRIAAGAFVTRSIPPYSLVVGNPAQVVRENCHPDVMNAWSDGAQPAGASHAPAA